MFGPIRGAGGEEDQGAGEAAGCGLEEGLGAPAAQLMVELGGVVVRQKRG